MVMIFLKEKKKKIDGKQLKSHLFSTLVNDRYPGVSSYSKTINQSALFSIMRFINVLSVLPAAAGWRQLLGRLRNG